MQFSRILNLRELLDSISYSQKHGHRCRETFARQSSGRGVID